MAVCAVFSCVKTISAQAYSSSDSLDAIDNIFDENQGKFSEKNLSKLAQKAGYTDLDEMITAAESGDTKTAADFQHSTVKFGKSYGGEGANACELVWIPAYLSNSSQGPVLTLWLARTYESGDKSNSNQSAFNPQWNMNAATKPSSNNYSTSKIRTEALNNTGVHYDGYDYSSSDKTSSLTAVNYTATTEKTHRYQMYTTGVLASYIVAPSSVSWQTGEGSNRLKNDPGWTGDTNGYYFQDKDGNEQTWVNDKLWLPSIYEVLDGSITVNSMATSFSATTTSGVATDTAAGLWCTNISERNDTYSTWTRSAVSNVAHQSYMLSGVSAIGDYYGTTSVCGVRPALHLNLRMAKNNAIVHIHKWQTSAETDADGWKVTKQATCTEEGAKERICTAADCTLTDNKEIETIEIDPTAHTPGTAATCTEPQICEECEEELVPAKGHNYATAWTTDDDNHWHVCNNGCGIKDSDGEHSGGTANCQQKATCEVCGQTYGSLGGHVLEHHEAKAPTCTEIVCKEYD
ncbi:MAG: hypothetical protein K2O67_01070, partial [Clostridia bacterium]|nr:hypothetical protein [Clostridia bacterium]